MSKISKDNPCPALLIISLEISCTGIILLHAHQHVVYSNCVKFHHFEFISKGEVANMDDRSMDRMIPATLYEIIDGRPDNLDYIIWTDALQNR